jgi:replicative DNA helicase
MNREEAADTFRKPIAERALLAFAMGKSDYYYDMASKMSVNDFLDPENRVVFSIMDSLAKKGFEAFDMTAIANEAQSNGALEAAGGYKYLNSLGMIEKNYSNYDHYLTEVLDASTKFKLHRILINNIAELEKKAETTADDSIGAVENQILDLSTTSKAIDEPINIGEDVGSYIEMMKENPVEMTGLPSGYYILDKQIDGLEPGTLMLIAARKKMGKSAFLTNIACHLAYNAPDKYRCPVLYVDTELPYGQWRTRVLANISGVKERKIKHGGYNEQQYERLKQAEELMKCGKLFHHFMPGYSVDKLVALYKKYKIKEDIGLIVFDYIKEPGIRDTNRAEHQILGDVTTKLKDLAGQMNIPAIGAVQLSRANEVADSDKISRYADIVAFWAERSKEEIDDSPGGYDSGNFKLIIRDSRRGGRTGEDGINYKFYKQRLAIREVSPEQQLVPYDHEGVVNDGDAEYEDDTTDTAYEKIQLR